MATSISSIGKLRFTATGGYLEGQLALYRVLFAVGGAILAGSPGLAESYRASYGVKQSEQAKEQNLHNYLQRKLPGLLDRFSTSRDLKGIKDADVVARV